MLSGSTTASHFTDLNYYVLKKSYIFAVHNKFGTKHTSISNTIKL